MDQLLNVLMELKWYKEGNLHREDGPAIEYADGTKYWYKNNLLHREDAPAIEYANGNKYWYKSGKIHREDGPAIEHYSGTIEWFLNDRIYGIGNEFTNNSWKTFVKTLIFS